MKDQQIDALALYKAYYRFLQENPATMPGTSAKRIPIV